MTFHQLGRALGYYLDQASVLLVISYIFLCYGVRNDDNPLILALTIQLVNSLIGIFQFVIRISADIENYMNAISRCLEYARLPTEATLRYQKVKQKKSKRTGRQIKPLDDSFTDLNSQERKEGKIDSWIGEGEVFFQNVTMHYRQDLPPALNGFTI